MDRPPHKTVLRLCIRLLRHYPDNAVAAAVVVVVYLDHRRRLDCPLLLSLLCPPRPMRAAGHCVFPTPPRRALPTVPLSFLLYFLAVFLYSLLLLVPLLLLSPMPL